MTLIPTVPNSLRSIPVEPVYVDMAASPLVLDATAEPLHEAKTAPDVRNVPDYVAALTDTYTLAHGCGSGL